MPKKKRDNSKRDYDLEYKRDQKSRIKYRSELKRARKKLGAKKGDPRDVIHKGGKIVGLGSRRKNRQEGARNAARARVRRRK